MTEALHSGYHLHKHPERPAVNNSYGTYFITVAIVFKGKTLVEYAKSEKATDEIIEYLKAR